eukprot:TRINITY_DN2352_c0_g1_i1.p1 TRINITY_DN2352_c0_g1~~TRINITY_DN2352_c0_g1_i1.p1  ORF type:complete len:927 (+),score=148.93 TRINITY_DN2352_c0_g1_i1:254-3034(+)
MAMTCRALLTAEQRNMQRCGSLWFLLSTLLFTSSCCLPLAQAGFVSTDPVSPVNKPSSEGGVMSLMRESEDFKRAPLRLSRELKDDKASNERANAVDAPSAHSSPVVDSSADKLLPASTSASTSVSSSASASSSRRSKLQGGASPLLLQRSMATAQMTPITSCPSNPLAMCDFYFRGNEFIVPMLSLNGPADKPASQLLLDAKSGTTVDVHMSSCGSFLCPTEGNCMTTTESQFYVHLARVQFREFKPATKRSFENQCVMLPVTHAHLTSAAGIVSLFPGDNNPKYPESRRCVIFKTGPRGPSSTCAPPPSYSPMPAYATPVDPACDCTCTRNSTTPVLPPGVPPQVAESDMSRMSPLGFEKVIEQEEAQLEKEMGFSTGPPGMVAEVSTSTEGEVLRDMAEAALVGFPSCMAAEKPKNVIGRLCYANATRARRGRRAAKLVKVTPNEVMEWFALTKTSPLLLPTVDEESIEALVVDEINSDVAVDETGDLPEDMAGDVADDVANDEADEVVDDVESYVAGDMANAVLEDLASDASDVPVKSHNKWKPNKNMQKSSNKAALKADGRQPLPGGLANSTVEPAKYQLSPSVLLSHTPFASLVDLALRRTPRTSIKSTSATSSSSLEPSSKSQPRKPRVPSALPTLSAASSPVISPVLSSVVSSVDVSNLPAPPSLRDEASVISLTEGATSMSATLTGGAVPSAKATLALDSESKDPQTPSQTSKPQSPSSRTSASSVPSSSSTSVNPPSVTLSTALTGPARSASADVAKKLSRAASSSTPSSNSKITPTATSPSSPSKSGPKPPSSARQSRPPHQVPRTSRIAPSSATPSSKSSSKPSSKASSIPRLVAPPPSPSNSLPSSRRVSSGAGITQTVHASTNNMTQTMGEDEEKVIAAAAAAAAESQHSAKSAALLAGNRHPNLASASVMR